VGCPMFCSNEIVSEARRGRPSLFVPVVMLVFDWFRFQPGPESGSNKGPKLGEFGWFLPPWHELKALKSMGLSFLSWAHNQRISAVKFELWMYCRPPGSGRLSGNRLSGNRQTVSNSLINTQHSFGVNDSCFVWECRLASN
jgi:hypothetical protein